MTTPSSWKTTIPVIKETDPVKAYVVNKSVNAVAERTDYLRAVLDDVYSSEFTYVRSVAVEASTVQGQLVYWNADTRAFGAAIAQWDDTLLNSDGTLKPSDTSVVIGVLVNKFTDTTGSIVLGGYIRDFADKDALFGESAPVAGSYYLSGSNAGQVTLDTPPLAIMAVVYDGEGNLWLPTVRFEHSTHDHKKYELSDSLWIAANTTNFPSYDIPVGATYGYDLAHAPAEILEIFTLYPGIASFTYVDTQAGIPDSLIYVNENNIWWTSVTAPTADIYMWLTAPNSHGPNIVRAIKTTTPERLDISLVNGMATVDLNEYDDVPNQSGYTVVKDIAGKNKKRGPIVEKILDGEGIAITSSGPVGQGIVEITLAEYSTKYIDASLINLNNALQYTYEDVMYSAFPAERESSMLGVAEVPKWKTATTKKMGIWLWMRGPHSGGVPLPDISVEVFVFPSPETSPQSMPTTPITFTLAGGTSTDNNKYYLMEATASQRIDVSSQSQVQYKLSLDNTSTSNDYLVLRQGIIIY